MRVWRDAAGMREAGLLMNTGGITEEMMPGDMEHIMALCTVMKERCKNACGS